jgi:hypothetical protein
MITSLNETLRIHVWALRENYSVDGMGGHTELLGLFTNEAAARKAGEGKRNYGGNLIPVQETLEVFNTCADWQANELTDLKVNALLKLTPEERNALGLPHPSEM